PLVPPCWRGRTGGSLPPAARRLRRKRARTLVLALPPPIRFLLPGTDGERDAGTEAEPARR
ncbi:MAG TPA: hypothetical protein VKF62_14980, partial [Planctomycetota bacterium]|nr:hypothetical protein [Planctomycetota bacterium]